MLFQIRYLVKQILYHLKKNKSNYWDIQRKGANFFNQNPSNEWFVAAKEVGIKFARLAPDKWKSEKKDFLVGDTDNFQKIPQSDYELLKRVLKQAYDNEIKVVITLLSLPG